MGQFQRMHLFVVTRSPRGYLRNMSDNGILWDFGRPLPTIDPGGSVAQRLDATTQVLNLNSS